MSIEIERKYIIKKPELQKIRAADEYSSSEITQIYLPSVSGVSHRVRRRVFENTVSYTETKKLRIDGMSAEEIEREITEREYESLAALCDGSLRPVTKVRHTFVYCGQLFEIDIYPEWSNFCIMETELESRGAVPKIPEFIHIEREVTGDFAYSNHSMARSFPPEPSR